MKKNRAKISLELQRYFRGWWLWVIFREPPNNARRCPMAFNPVIYLNLLEISVLSFKSSIY
ncbi:hypothetical protein L323_12690 [Ruminiclostridium papyrosolvens C7]|uniref:Uncharacterized protein n=1 Tax=Ruminiclostridium papyrosolvens C7 TaxID=1330534 RepID=U4R135_9FIRM|nr:hypothetical protein L323_12690 [Ruminiclostridium papyrosolvens C7]